MARFGIVTSAATLVLTAGTAWAQSFNIDLDDPGAPSELGGGAPSDAFGGAAGQRGFWNSVHNVGPGPFSLRDTHNGSTSVSVRVVTDELGYSGIASDFQGNTGDYARLLNDAGQVGSAVQGGRLMWSFSGLSPGSYEVYTYAVRTAGASHQCASLRAGGTRNADADCNGPMPGNAFAYHVTHSIHHVAVGVDRTIHVIINEPPNMAHTFDINGFQIVSVPRRIRS